jgi:hypothetical protein
MTPSVNAFLWKCMDDPWMNALTGGDSSKRIQSLEPLDKEARHLFSVSPKYSLRNSKEDSVRFSVRF